MTDTTMADRIALYLGGGLVIFGTVVVGLLDMLLGAGHPVTGEGQIVHEAVLPIKVRSYIILAGLVIWGLYAVYRVAATPPSATTQTRREAGQPE
jgi:hypothetical protein